MIVEALISVYKGHDLIKREPKELHQKGHRNWLLKADISRFYFPLAFYFVIQSLLVPLIYILLAKSSDIEMCIASFADRKSTRLNSSHVAISYSFFCLT